MNGKAKEELLDNPGILSESVNWAIENGAIHNPDKTYLKKYFWDVDMSVPGNEFGVDNKNDKIDK